MRKVTIVIGLVMTVLALMAVLVPAVIQAQASKTIYACYNNYTRILRYVSGSNQCSRNETQISWNSIGPAGPAGPTGPAGPAGPALDLSKVYVAEFNPASDTCGDGITDPAGCVARCAGTDVALACNISCPQQTDSFTTKIYSFGAIPLLRATGTTYWAEVPYEGWSEDGPPYYPLPGMCVGTCGELPNSPVGSLGVTCIPRQ